MVGRRDLLAWDTGALSSVKGFGISPGPSVPFSLAVLGLMSTS